MKMKKCAKKVGVNEETHETFRQRKIIIFFKLTFLEIPSAILYICWGGGGGNSPQTPNSEQQTFQFKI